MKRPAALFLAIFLLFCSFSSCSPKGKAVSCRNILEEITKNEIGLPAGKLYFRNAEKGDEEYLPDSLIGALFGGGSFPSIAEKWIDVALFLSLNDHPCEIAVILCRDRDTAHDTAKVLSERLAAIRLTKFSPEYSTILQNAIVTIVDNYALLIISSDSQNALKIFMRNK